jgi:signal transduction histidine kinase/putative methionine-R-sulfoxide reductase with GAF domain
MPAPTPEQRAGELLARLAELAFVCTGSNDLAALVDIAAETCREAVGGRAWRFLSVDESSGALTAGPPGSGGPPVLPEPGGLLESMLAHEAPLLAVQGRVGDPKLERALWPAGTPDAVMAWPVLASDTLRGVLLVALDAMPDAMPGANPGGELVARIACDQLALALERQALAEARARQAEAMSQVEERAHSGEALFSELIAVVAHEIRTPLTSIKAYTETLIDAPDTAFEQRRAFLTVIDEECDRLARLVSDALDLSRLEAGHRALKLTTMRPGAFVEDLKCTVEPEAARHGVRLVTELDPALGEVEGDPDLLKQLVLNLLGNALKFSPNGAPVTIRARAEGGEWQLDVVDAGVGIPEELLDRVFERFYRVELKGGRRVPGTGLGLAIARHIVDLHGGRIWAENAPGGGSIFSLRLPLRQLAPESVCAVARSLGGREDVRRLLGAAVDMVGEQMASEIVSVLLVDPEIGDLVVSAARGLDEAAYARRLSYRGGVAGAAIRVGRPLLVDNVETDRRIHKQSHPQYFTKSLLCVPIQVAGEIIGVLNVNNKVSREEFDESDRALLASLTDRLTAALQRAQAYPDAPSVVQEACGALQSLARPRRDLLAGRRELGHYAFEIARRLALEPAECARIALLAGGDPANQAGITRPDASGTDEGGADEAAARSAILVARAERMDGAGWPRGLAGGAIPLGARVLAVLDSFEALTRARAYRSALPVDEALGALDAGAGRAFDPRVLGALRATLEDDGRLGDRREVA